MCEAGIDINTVVLEHSRFERSPDSVENLWRRQSGWYAADIDTNSIHLEIPEPVATAIYDRARREIKSRSLGADWLPPDPILRLRDDIEPILEGGAGFCVVRGLRPCGDIRVDARAILLLGLLFGTPVSQSRDGNLVASVRDSGGDLKNPLVRGHKTAAELPFHCDRADRVLIYCVRQARRGGRIRVASSIRLFESLSRTAPDLAECLSRPLPFDRRDVHARDEKPWISLPIFANQDDVFVARYIRRFIEESQRHQDCPRITRLQRKALDCVDGLLRDDGRAFEYRMLPGDVLLMNNNVVLHSREAFEDHSEAERRRLMLRVWLSHQSARPLPGEFTEIYGNNLPGVYRGGVWPVEREARQAPVVS